MATMRRRHGVGIREAGTERGGDRFLPDAEMDEPWHLAIGEEPREPLLDATDPDHRAHQRPGGL